MIELTVKTLDSQNHAFTVEDDITVAQFKVKIADTVNIPAETQRIIYCGRVLQDDAKLKDYDVNGKVVHLVQRAPPVRSQSGTPRSASPQQQRRGYRVLEHGNAMYLGSMAFPSNLMESQGIVPPPPTHSLAASRLNVAKRMLKRAEAVIKSLEDPQSRPTEQTTPPEEPQEEVTPVFEARVIVPSMNEPIDEALVLSAVENSLLNVGAVPVAATTSENAPVESNNASTSVPMNEDVGDEGFTATSSEPQRGESSGSGGANVQENASRTAEMAELLTMLGQLQIRFAPFLQRYQNFMQEDRVVPEEELRPTQTMLNRVSEVMHFLGHAYHSLSDIIVKARTPPPRALLCRPILIQHSAVVQTGFPIQLEAQINFSTDRPSTTTANTTDTTTTTTTTTSSSNTTTAAAPTISAQIQPSMLGIPFFPGASMHVQPFPIAIRAISRPVRPANNNTASTEAATAAQPQGPGDSSANTAAAGAATGGTTDGAFNLPGFNNPNVEFLMEVTPESITIDSLETSLIGSNPTTDDTTRHAVTFTDQDFLQSIMHIMNGVVTSAAATTEPSAPPSETSAVTTTTSTSVTNQAPSSGQNSQARGNTQTNPTTATHTRSTSRPHVHLAQHAMQGFDPFLPCNSHHVSSRRRIHIQNSGQSRNVSSDTQNQRERETTVPNTATQHFHRNLVHTVSEAFIDAFNSAQLVRMQIPDTTNRTNANTTAQNSTASQTTSRPPFPIPPLPFMQNMNIANAGDFSPMSLFFPLNGLYEEGNNIFTDLLFLASRHLSGADTVQLSAGRLESLVHFRSELREFVLRRILDNSSSTAAVDRGVNKIISEITFLNELGSMPVRDDIDVVRSVQMLLRSRLPNIINLTISRSPNALRMLFDQCQITLRQLGALLIRANTRGQDGIVEVFEQSGLRYMSGIPRQIRQWVIATIKRKLISFMSDLSVPESILQPYIVKKTEAVLPPVAGATQNNTDEPMELDSPATSTSSNESVSINLSDDGDPLPAVVIGSEPWHSQVPAEWVPIIARDSQRQRRQNPQQPFSDAYLSGMPSKRRKIVTNAKPQGSLPQVITESVRRAVTATGLASVAPLETVAQEAGQDLTIQSAYRDLFRTTVQATVQNNEDFTPDRFPNASNYFNKQ